MRKLNTIASICLVITLMSRLGYSDQPLIFAWHDIKENGQCYKPYVDGNGVAFLVEAHSTPVLDPIPKQMNTRGYLVTAKVVESQPDVKSRIVIGPLYKIDGPMSGLASSAGAAFGKQDRQALSQRPFFAFGGGGTLVRSVVADDHKHCSDSVLKIGEKMARWSAIGTRPLISHRGKDGDYYFESNSGRLIIEQEDDGEVHIYERSTDSRIRDPWVEAVAKDLFAQVDLQERYVVLTEDLKFLIVRLDISRLVRNGDKEELLTTFTLNGKQFERENSTLVYTRPSERPHVLDAKNGLSSTIVSADGKSLRLRTSKVRIELCDLDGGVIMSHKAPSDLDWFSRSQELRHAN